MKSFSLLAASLTALGLVSSPAMALSARTFVSGAGSDSGVCPVATPCRTFAYALTQTAPGGEIIVLSSAGYGAVTITQAVSIINANYFAGVTVASGSGIVVNAGANDSVILVGLTIGATSSGGTNGIVFNSGKSLTVSSSTIKNFTQVGLLISPSTASTLTVSDSLVTENGTGVRISASGGSVISTLTRIQVLRNSGKGIHFDGAGSGGSLIKGYISDSVVSINGQEGVYTNNGSGSPFFLPSVVVTRCSINANTGVGLLADGTGIIVVANSSLEDNAAPWGNGGAGFVTSYGDNYTRGAGAPNSFPRN